MTAAETIGFCFCDAWNNEVRTFMAFFQAVSNAEMVKLHKYFVDV